MSSMIRKGFNINSNVPAASPERAKFVKGRLVELAKNAAEVLLETGLLLKEFRDNGYFKEDGYASFDEAIDAMHEKGMFEYKARNARNMISIVEMAQKNKLGAGDIDGIGISKLREIASLPPADQKEMLSKDSTTGEVKAKKMSVAEVQKQAKVKRAKAKGHDVDPLDAITFMTTATQKTMINTCIEKARRIYGIPDTVTPTGVLVDVILAEWESGLSADQLEAADNAGVIEGQTVEPEVQSEPTELEADEIEDDSDPDSFRPTENGWEADKDEDDEPLSLVADDPEPEPQIESQADDDFEDASELSDEDRELAEILASAMTR